MNFLYSLQLARRRQDIIIRHRLILLLEADRERDSTILIDEYIHKNTSDSFIQNDELSG
jgi:hypothetical protein